MEHGPIGEEEQTRWEPPRQRVLVPPREAIRRSAGLRLDVGWIIAVRGGVAGVLLLGALWPDRPVLLVLVGVIAAVCLVSSAPLFRLPLRLRLANRIEAVTVGVVGPLAVVQAYVASSLLEYTAGTAIVVFEIGAVLALVMIGLAALVESRSDLWSPAARTLVLWPSALVPGTVLVGARSATTPDLALALGGTFLVAALVTVAARLAPLRVAPLVIVGGTASYLVLVLASGSGGVLERGVPAVVVSLAQSGLGIALLVPRLRERVLLLIATIAGRSGFRPVAGKRFAEETDRDRGDFVSLL